MEAAWPSERLVSHVTAQCHNIDNHNLHFHHCQNLKSHIKSVIMHVIESFAVYFVLSIRSVKALHLYTFSKCNYGTMNCSISYFLDPWNIFIYLITGWL
jgi:hypothetical protein